MHDIIESDCLDRAQGLFSLEDGSADVAILDPPYDANTHGKQRRGQTPDYTEPTRPNSEVAQFSRARHLGFEALTPRIMFGVALELQRVVRRWTLVFCAVEMVADWRKALEVAGLEYVRTQFWRKLGAAPQFTGDRPAQSAECIVTAHPRGRKKWNGGGRHGWYESDSDEVHTHPIVLNRGKVKTRFHTAQKPVGLMRDLVQLFSDPGEIVIDPFCGSGTTGVACVELGRNFVGWDKDPVSCADARLRLGAAQPLIMPWVPGTRAKEGAV
jgi:site-specific DNA-methyltransferase (adenine-specific)